MKKLLALLVMSSAVTAALFLLTTLSGPGGAHAPQSITLKPSSVIQEGSFVSIEYTLTDDSGNVLDSNVGKEPLTYIQGAGQVVKGLERALLGLKVGDQKKVSVKPEDGYPVNPDAFQEIPKDKLPPDALKVGTLLATKTQDGQSIPMRVHEIKDKTVIVDFNHPLAGKALNFDVTIKDIRAAETR